MPARRMIPYEQVAPRLLEVVVTILREHGVIEPADNAKAFRDQVIAFFKDQDPRAITPDGLELKLGACVFLPTSAQRISLLVVTPCPADEYGPNLERKSSPVQFERTPQDKIILPGRWLLARFEDQASNPAASEGMRTAALNLARAGPVADLVLPAGVETVAVRVPNEDGTETVFEALPPGQVVFLIRES